MKLGSLGRGIMAFNGTANGAEAPFLADTGANFSMYDDTYGGKHGFAHTECHL
jgi:hypothetical protein